MATETGPLIASGRDGDIYEFGPGLVLRARKSGRVIEGEARIIAYAREHGYPVPEIHEVRSGGTEIVMERIEGPMMMDLMLRRPVANAALLPHARGSSRSVARDPRAGVAPATPVVTASCISTCTR